MIPVLWGHHTQIPTQRLILDKTVVLDTSLDVIVPEVVVLAFPFSPAYVLFLSTNREPVPRTREQFQCTAWK